MWTDSESLLTYSNLGFSNTKTPVEQLNPDLDIYMFDLDDTLITPKGKSRPGAPYTEWKFCKDVVKKLKTVFINKNQLMVIVSNQKNLDNYKEDFKTKLENVIKSLNDEGINPPIIAYVANGLGNNRKPNTGIISDHFLPLLKEKGVTKFKLVYVGDAAGRESDHSDSDRKFLMNINLLIKANFAKSFKTDTHFEEPEQFFQGKKATKFTLQGLDPQKFLNSFLTGFSYTKGVFAGEKPQTPMKDGKKRKLSDLDTSISYLKVFSNEKNPTQEVILLIGPPGSGKSIIAKRVEKEWGYVRINQDLLGKKEKVDNMLETTLDSGKSVILDSTNSDSKRRREQINIAQKYFKNAKKPIIIRAFVMNGNLSVNDQRLLAEHLNAIRERKGLSRVPQIGVRMYYKNYSPPTEDEGFTQIQSVNFVPCFTAKDILHFMQRS